MKTSVKKVVAALVMLLVLQLVLKADGLDYDKNADEAAAVEWQPKVLRGTVQDAPRVNWKVSEPADKYNKFMSQMHGELLKTTTKPPIELRPVLGRQSGNGMPDKWINVTLEGRGRVESTVFIRADNIYLVGFKTQAGHIYTFKYRKHLIEGSTALNFEDTYSSLTGSNYEAIGGEVFSKASSEAALQTLASYNGGSTDEKKLKNALLKFVIMISEASRFQLFRKDVAAALGRDAGGKLSGATVKMTMKWAEISCALLDWDKKKKWEPTKELKDLGDPKIKSPKAAAGNVFYILQVSDCTKI